MFLPDSFPTKKGASLSLLHRTLPPLLLLLLLSLLSHPAHGQYPQVLDSVSFTYGGCSSDADCLVFLQIYTNLTADDIVCNPAMNRCQIAATGAVLAPAFGTTCPQLSLAHTVFPSMSATASTADGMLAVRVTVPDGNLRGVLRLFLVASPPSNLTNLSAVQHNITSQYVEEQYANYPITVYTFRNLRGGQVYDVQYNHQTGCAARLPALASVALATSGGYFPGVFSINASSGFTTIPGVVEQFHASRRAARVYLSAGMWDVNTHIHDSSLPLASGARVPFGQVFDGSGGVLATVVGRALFLSNASVGGAAFPPNAPAALVATTLELTYLAGVASIQLGIGFGYQAVPNGPLVMIADGKGVLEGYMRAPLVLVLANVTRTPAVNNTPPYRLPQHFSMGGVFSQTRFLFTPGTNPFGSINLTQYPVVRILQPGIGQTENVNAMCLGPSVTYAVVALDYTVFPFSAVNVTMRVRRVVFGGAAGLSLVDTSPPQIASISAGVRYATVSEPGTYCIQIVQNLLDGFGTRPTLQTCVQVGYASAGITQVRSAYAADQNSAYPFTPSAGYGAVINTVFHVSLPLTLVLLPGQEIRLTLTRASPDPVMMAQLVRTGGVSTDIFNDPVGDFDMAAYYTASRPVGPAPGAVPTSYTLYTLRQSMVNGPAAQVTISTRPGQNVLNEVAMAVLTISNYTVATAAAAGAYPYNNMTCGGSPSAALADCSPAVSAPLQYICQTAAQINMLETTEIKATIAVKPPICSTDSAEMNADVSGAFGFIFDNDEYIVPGHPAGGSFPFTDPIAYYTTWINSNTGAVLLSGFNRWKFPAPPNVPITLVVTDATGQTASADALAVSVVSVNETVIRFAAQKPVCVDGSVQYTEIATTVLSASPAPVGLPAADAVIAYWQPLDVTALENYNPNVPLHNLPSDCALLAHYPVYTVHVMCGQFSTNLNASANCTGCATLPIQYAEAASTAAGSILRSARDQQWWEFVVWKASSFLDANTGRHIYCRTSQSILTQVAAPISASFTQLQRITSVNSVPCTLFDCFSVQIAVILDAYYAPLYAANTALFAAPLLECIGPGGAGGCVAAGGTGIYAVHVPTDGPYNITLTMVAGSGATICPTNLQYVPAAAGPVVFLVRTTRTSCDASTGSAVIYMGYNDPAFTAVGTQRDVCLRWPRLSTSPFSFTAPVNALTPLVLPYAGQFGIYTQRFAPLSGGAQEFIIYDQCAPSDCLSCIGAVGSTAQFAVTNPAAIRFAYRPFFIQTFDDPGGGIHIERTDYEPARCWGDAYRFNFSFTDDTLADVGGYEVHFFKAFDGVPLYTFGTCVPGPPVGNSRPFGSSRVQLGPFHVEVPTGGVAGLGLSGNYTFTVKSCRTHCATSFATYIDAVNPIRIFLSSAGTGCAYKPAGLVPSILGGTPYNHINGNLSLTYELAPGVFVPSPYRTYWVTPVAPDAGYVETVLPLAVVAGVYSLKACDANECCAVENITVTTAPPIEVSVVGFDAVCQQSAVTTVRLNVTGGIPPYRTMQEFATLTSNSTVSVSLLGQLVNETVTIHIIDSSGCLLPTAVSFAVPDPGPVNITIARVDSCARTATGSITVTADELIACRYFANGAPLPTLQTCTLTALPPGTFLTVVAQTIIGCQTTGTVLIGTRPPVLVAQLFRGTTGVFGDCVDNITLSVTGGQTGPPYAVALANDATNATLVRVDNHTYAVLGVCRALQYTIVASESDNECASVFLSTDPEFTLGAGGGGGSFIPGLPPPDDSLFPFVPTLVRIGRKSAQVRSQTLAWSVAGGTVALLIIAGVFTLAFAARRMRTLSAEQGTGEHGRGRGGRGGRGGGRRDGEGG